MAISCGYCGGSHRVPAEVKACWATSQSGGSAVQAALEVPAAQRSESAPGPLDVGPGSLQPPARLGRNLVIRSGGSIAPAWESSPRLVIGPGEIDAPQDVIDQLHRFAATRQGVVIELSGAVELVLDPLHAPQTVETRAPHQLGPRFTLVAEQLHHLVWANSIDGRDPLRPRWGLISQAILAGGSIDARTSGGADVMLPTGGSVWLDGGPPRFTEPLRTHPVVHAMTLDHGSLAVPIHNDTDAALAPDQLAAVTHEGGTARIIAPAGSGKTRVLTERSRHVLSNWLVPPGAVSLVAFNKRAQQEMRDRTADLPGLQVRTLNSIALAVLNGTAPFARRPHRVDTIGEPEVRRIIGDLVTFPRRRNTDPVAPWIEALGQIRLGLVDPAEVEARFDGDVDGLTKVWPAYRAALERRSVVDFDGQIHGAILALLREPVVRRAAQHASRLLLVDEFQDLTPAHVLLVRLLAGPSGAVFGVGDDDQTIYGYNGADPGWLIDFQDLFPGAGSHPLQVNYRCPPQVVEAVDRLLRHNRRRVPKVIRAHRATEPETPPHPLAPGWSVLSSRDPVHEAVRTVTEAIGQGVAPRDIAVLTRVNALLAPVQVALSGSGIGISGGVGLEFVDRTAVRATLAWLRLALGGLTALDLHEALRRPSRPLPPRVTEWVAEQRDLAGLRKLAGRLNEDRESDRVASFADDIETMQSLVQGDGTMAQLVDQLIDEMGLGGTVATLDVTRRGMNRPAQGDDLGALRQLAGLHEDPRTFETWLRERLAVRRDPLGVVLSTVHRVKGQEWPHVVVHQADADQYPHRLSEDIEEERRLFHVALTRASHRVVVVAGVQPSSFIAELSTEPPVQIDEPPSAPVSSRSGASAGTRSSADPSGGPVHPLLDRAQVTAAEGIDLVDQGTVWTVETVDAEGLTARRGNSTRRFAFGTAVVTAGRQRGTLRPPDQQIPAAVARAFEGLRIFRERARGAKPAYTVFDDKTLAALAVALPGDLSTLAQVRGVGPAKLENYGAEILDLIEEAVALSPSGGAQ